MCRSQQRPRGHTEHQTTYWLSFTRLHRQQVEGLLERYWRCADEHDRSRYVEHIIAVLRPLLRHAAQANHQHRSPLGLDVEDFLVYAEVAAYKAIVSYDPARNDNFFAYLYTIVNNETIKHLDRELPIPSTQFHSRQRNTPENQACLSILNARSLEEQNDRNRWLKHSDNPESHLLRRDEDYSESDGQLVLCEMLDI